jgi:hypothetical protein
MADIGGSQSDAFHGDGIGHAVNTGRANLGSISLQQDSERWDAMSNQAATTPHSVLATYSFSRSANGSDGENMLPNGTFLGSSNGQSSDSFDKSLMLGMAGSGSNDNLP